MIVTLKFNTVVEANNWCKGAIDGGANPAGDFPGLVGSTITFAVPAGSCTFTQPADSPAGLMKFKDVKAQLEAAISTLKVECVDRKIVFFKAALDGPCSLAAVNEAGRVPLGLPNNEAVAGTFLTPPGGAKPMFVSIVPEAGAIYITYDK